MELSHLIPISFDLFWRGSEWASKQIFENELEIEKQVTLIKEPDENICEVLDSFHSTFFPNEPKQNINEVVNAFGKPNGSVTKLQEFFPWNYHKGIFRAKEKIGEDRFLEILKNKLKEEWLISWHWRAVLLSLKKWNKDHFFIVQISHIRKWEMLLCYYIEKSVLNDIDKLSQIDLKSKNLLRAPLFGISHRLKGWDTYRLFYQENIKEQIKEKVKKPHPSNLDIADVLGRHDYYYLIENVERINNSYKWSLRTFMELFPEEVVDNNIFGKTIYNKPSYLIDIPSFEKTHEGIPQLLSSDNYCEAIYELTEVLNDPTAKSVLLIAPPGSGKEKLAESSFYCRDQEEFSGNFIATTLAGLNANTASKILFSFDTDREELKFEKGRLLIEKEKFRKQGLIFQALDGALFIDEIDKTDKGVRNLLLRVLESGEFTVHDTSIVIKIDKENIPLYIFAGSMSRKSMFELSLSDFWTRISHVIEVAHPLRIDDIDEAKKVVKDYLWMFWCHHVKEFMKKKGIKKASDLDAENIFAPLNEFYIELYNFLIDKATVNFATDILANEISGRGKTLVSIRTLRSIVSRAVFKFVELLLYSKFDNDPIELLKEECRYKPECNNPKEWFGNLKNIILNKANNPYFSVIESFKSAIRLGTTITQQ